MQDAFSSWLEGGGYKKLMKLFWEKSSWQERMSTVTGITMKTVKHEEVVYEKRWQFLEFDHKHAVTLKPDNYEYDFDVVIPGGK